MATWMVHFRIADSLLDSIKVNAQQFIVGNIGPDCGEPNEDWSAFYPPTSVSHWMSTSSKSSINCEAFYEKYMKNCSNRDKYAFYLGYYAHLVTDILWREKIYAPALEKYKDEFLKDRNFIWVVKKDWYDLDHKFLKDNPDFRAFRIFDHITSFRNVYLDYFTETAIENRIHYISDFYNTHEGSLDREYPYLKEETVDAFIPYAVDVIKKDLLQRKVLKG